MHHLAKKCPSIISGRKSLLQQKCQQNFLTFREQQASTTNGQVKWGLTANIHKRFPAQLASWTTYWEPWNNAGCDRVIAAIPWGKPHRQHTFCKGNQRHYQQRRKGHRGLPQQHTQPRMTASFLHTKRKLEIEKQRNSKCLLTAKCSAPSMQRHRQLEPGRRGSRAHRRRDERVARFDQSSYNAP